MKEMHRARDGERMGRFHAFSGVSFSQYLHVFSNPLSELCLFGFLWRLHYIGMTD